MKETAICIVDDHHRVVRQGGAASEPEAVAVFLLATGLALERVGIQAGPLAPWLCDGLATAGLPVICIDAQHMKAAVRAMPVKTDRIDARNIAVAMQVGCYRPVHLERPVARKPRVLLSSREMLVRTRIDLDNHIRGVLKAFGLKVGEMALGQPEAGIWDLIDDGDAPIRLVIGYDAGDARRVVTQLALLHRAVLAVVRQDQVCRRLMTVPGVGDHRTRVQDRDRRASTVPELGCGRLLLRLTPSRYASGVTDYTGHITSRRSWLRRWDLEVLKRRGMMRATAAGRDPASDVAGRHRFSLATRAGGRQSGAAA